MNLIKFIIGIIGGVCTFAIGIIMAVVLIVPIACYVTKRFFTTFWGE